MAPLVAEMYGLDHPGQLAAAKMVREIFQSESGIVDVDDSVEYPGPRLNLHVDRQKAARLGVAQEQIAAAVAAALGGEDATHLHGSQIKYAVPIRLEFAVADQGDLNALLALRVRSHTSGALVPLAELIDVEETVREVSRIHKHLLPVVFVTGDEAGEVDSPLYGLFDVSARLKETVLPSGGVLEQFFVRQPELPVQYGLKWDGEWQITYETFRDMGLASSVGLLLIYLLVVAQFRSYTVPLIIMAPIPLTVIGVLPGHALLGAQFTATSMIGMIALAGIIVRNSILLVDFIHLETARGAAFEEAVIRAAAVRAKPFLLTAWLPGWGPCSFSTTPSSTAWPSR